MKDQNKDKDKNPNQISLTFIVNGTETVVEKVNIHLPLHVPANEALKQTGQTRPLSEWQVIYDDKTLDVNKKVEDYNFPEDAVIFLSLKAGQGGI